MTKAEAHRLLDSARNGDDVSELDILIALRATGDLSPMRVFSREDWDGQSVPELSPVGTHPKTAREFA